VVAPGDENRLRNETPTIAEFFKKNGYTTYFSGKWHLGDKPDAYPIEHGFDEMKNFAAYYAGVCSYNDTDKGFHPWCPSFNPQYNAVYDSIVNLGEWEGVAGQAAKKVGTITYDSLADYDIRLTDSAIDYIKQHAKSDQPFSWMSISSRCTIRPTQRLRSGAVRISATTRIPSWRWTTTSAES
jgi:arylsulfatase A-like enzyme